MYEILVLRPVEIHADWMMLTWAYRSQGPPNVEQTQTPRYIGLPLL